jgi:excinuclease UvrABC nuclease subunit
MHIAEVDPLTLPSLPLGERSRLPKCSAIYFVMRGEHVLYIGKTINLAQRWVAHHRWGQVAKLDAIKIAWLECNDENLLAQTEVALIKLFAPELNEIPDDKANDVFIRVFLNSEMRTHFKVACAKSEVAMSEKARELIEEWTISQETQSQNSSQSEDKGDK